MGKLTTFILIMSGLMLLFYFTGLIPNNPFLNLLLSPEDMTTTEFYITLTTAIAVGLGAIVIGFITKNLELAAMAVFVPIMITLMWNFISVYNKMASVNKVIAIILFAPLLFMFLVTMLDWWRGRD